MTEETTREGHPFGTVPLPPDSRSRRILAVATQGSGGDDEDRLRALLSRMNADFFPFDRKDKRGSFRKLLGTLRRTRPDLAVLEGTGIAGGLAVLIARLLYGVRYTVSSGDAVGPFVGSIRPILGPAFGFYERMLCRFSAGFIGWTPYLTGRALTFGAPRGMTAASWAPSRLGREERLRAREETRESLGIPRDAVVVGIVGSLAWNRRRGYCYGLELIRALLLTRRSDLRALIVGGGDGLDRLRAEAERDSLRRCVLSGRVPRSEVPRLLAATDVASLPQSMDGVGLFRYTTKISEYLAAGLPIVTGRLPFAYDLDDGEGRILRLPGDAPWDPVYQESLAELMERLDRSALESRRAAEPAILPEFDREAQIARVTSFLEEILADSPRERPDLNRVSSQSSRS